MEAINLANNSKINKRRDLDFYPTPPDVTHALMHFLNLEPCLIWEPACGDGAMAKVIEQYGHSVLASDLRDSGFGMKGIDFLKETPLPDYYSWGAIITNPPFAISEDFIRHAIPQANTVAMLLKSQYWHAAKRTTLFNEFPPAYVLALNWRPDFMNGERGGAPTMEVLWTVWQKGKTDTRYRVLQKPIL